MSFAVRKRVSGQFTIAVIVISAIIVVITSAVAWDGTVPDWERDILLFVNGWPGFLEPLFWVLQQFGILFAPVIAGVIIVWRTRKPLYLVPFVLVLPLKLFFEKAVVKALVTRERPFTSVGPEIEVRASAFEGPSFPSGHTTTAFALGVLLFAFVPPKWKPVMLAWSVITAIARLYYGEHNFLDVVAGAALGTTFAVVLWYTIGNRFVEDADVVN